MSINDGAVTLRPARMDDSEAVATVWYQGWCESHVEHVPDDLIAVRTQESFGLRASQRVNDMVVAVVDNAVAGFVLVAGDEVEQVYVSVHY